MPSKDTKNYPLTLKTRKELERIKKIISEELTVPINKVTFKHAEIVLRIKAERGKIKLKELNDILLGKIR